MIYGVSIEAVSRKGVSRRGPKELYDYCIEIYFLAGIHDFMSLFLINRRT